MRRDQFQLWLSSLNLFDFTLETNKLTAAQLVLHFNSFYTSRADASTYFLLISKEK